MMQLKNLGYVVLPLPLQSYFGAYDLRLMTNSTLYFDAFEKFRSENL